MDKKNVIYFEPTMCCLTLCDNHSFYIWRWKLELIKNLLYDNLVEYLTYTSFKVQNEWAALYVLLNVTCIYYFLNTVHDSTLVLKKKKYVIYCHNN